MSSSGKSNRGSRTRRLAEEPPLDEADFEPTSIDFVPPDVTPPPSTPRPRPTTSTPYGSVLAPGLRSLVPIGPHSEPPTEPNLRAPSSPATIPPNAPLELGSVADLGEETSEEIPLYRPTTSDVTVELLEPEPAFASPPPAPQRRPVPRPVPRAVRHPRPAPPIPQTAASPAHPARARVSSPRTPQPRVASRETPTAPWAILFGMGVAIWFVVAAVVALLFLGL